MFSRQIIQSAILLLALVNCTSKKYIQNFNQEAPREESRTVEVSTLPTQNQPVIYDGAGSSGGGKVVVCRDASGKINAPVELLEFWESRVIHGQTVKETNLSLRDKVMNSLLKISKTILLNPLDPLPYAPKDSAELLKGFKFDAEYWLQESANITRLRNINLLITPDSHEVASPAANCRIEQVVHYLDERHEIFLNQDLMDRMSKTNQAGLIVHEVLYAYLRRQNEEKNSLRTRWYVRMTFLDSLPNANLSGPRDGHYYCSDRTDFENDDSASPNVLLVASSKNPLAESNDELYVIPTNIFGIKLLDKERFNQDWMFRSFSLSKIKDNPRLIKFNHALEEGGVDFELDVYATMFMKGSELWAKVELRRYYPSRAPLTKEIPCRPIRFAIP